MKQYMPKKNAQYLKHYSKVGIGIFIILTGEILLQVSLAFNANPTQFFIKIFSVILYYIIHLLMRQFL